MFSNVSMDESIDQGFAKCDYWIVLDLDLLAAGKIDRDGADTGFYQS